MYVRQQASRVQRSSWCAWSVGLERRQHTPQPQQPSKDSGCWNEQPQGRKRSCAHVVPPEYQCAGCTCQVPIATPGGGGGRCNASKPSQELTRLAQTEALRDRLQLNDAEGHHLLPHGGRTALP